MLILDLTSDHFSESDTDQEGNSYPDEVLKSEWNPVLAEIRSVRTSGWEPSKPAPEVIDAALEWLHKN